MDSRTVSFGMGRLIPKKPTKYKSRACIVDGIRFPSQKQGRRYQDLKLLESQSLIRSLRLEVPYVLKVNGVKVCKYVADFVFEEYAHGVWTVVVEDCKGFLTPVYRLKKKLLKAVLGIEIRET